MEKSMKRVLVSSVAAVSMLTGGFGVANATEAARVQAPQAAVVQTTTAAKTKADLVKSVKPVAKPIAPAQARTEAKNDAVRTGAAKVAATKADAAKPGAVKDAAKTPAKADAAKTAVKAQDEQSSKPVAGTFAVDVSKLQEEITKAENGKYVQMTTAYDDLQRELTKAKNLVKSPTDQEAVDQAVRDLKDLEGRQTLIGDPTNLKKRIAELEALHLNAGDYQSSVNVINDPWGSFTVAMQNAKNVASSGRSQEAFDTYLAQLNDAYAYLLKNDSFTGIQKRITADRLLNAKGKYSAAAWKTFTDELDRIAGQLATKGDVTIKHDAARGYVAESVDLTKAEQALAASLLVPGGNGSNGGDNADKNKPAGDNTDKNKPAGDSGNKTGGQNGNNANKPAGNQAKKPVAKFGADPNAAKSSLATTGSAISVLAGVALLLGLAGAGLSLMRKRA